MYYLKVVPHKKHGHTYTREQPVISWRSGYEPQSSRTMITQSDWVTVPNPKRIQTRYYSAPVVIIHVAYLTVVVHNLMSVWIVQVGGGAPSWPRALLGAADRVGGDHPDRVRAGDSTRRCARLQRCICRRVRANTIVFLSLFRSFVCKNLCK